MPTSGAPERELKNWEDPAREDSSATDDIPGAPEKETDDGCGADQEADRRLRHFARELLSACDVLDMGVQARSIEDWSKPDLRMLAIHRERIERVFQSHGFERIASLGKHLDVSQHDVVEVVLTHVQEDDETIACVVQPGYWLNGQPVRRELVVVRKFEAPPNEEEPNEEEESNAETEEDGCKC